MFLDHLYNRWHMRRYELGNRVAKLGEIKCILLIAVCDIVVRWTKL